MTTEELFKQITNECISTPLKKIGFKKDVSNYSRDFPSFSQIINIQKSRWNTSEEIQFVLNIGFYNSKYHSELSKLPEPKKPKEYDCFVRFRLNKLTHNKDYWYSIKNSMECSNLKAEIENNFVNQLIPFLESNKTFEQLYSTIENEEWLRQQTGEYTLAYLHIQKGNIEKALIMLRYLYEEASKTKEVVSITNYPDGRQEKKVSMMGPRVEFISNINELCSKYDIKIGAVLDKVMC